MKKAKKDLRAAGCGTVIISHSARSLPSNASIGGNQKSDGFTLVEIVITIVLIGILSGVAAMIILQGVKAYSDEQSRSDVHYQARLAVERIAREARLIRSCADINGRPVNNPSSALSFTDISGNAVTFSIAGGNLSRGGDILAMGVNAQPFSFLDRNGALVTDCGAAPNDIWFIEIDVTSTQGGESLQMRTRVHPRNF